MQAKSPAFLFYPGDYLRDTQCLDSQCQVAYDRIMCEHMRNICSDMEKIVCAENMFLFFTKGLSDAQVNDLLCIVIKNNFGYQIEWVAKSICNRANYSESRAKNKSKKVSKTYDNISKSYDDHMEIEKEIEIEEEKVNEIKNEKKGIVKGKKQLIEFNDPNDPFHSLLNAWFKYKKEQHNFTYKSNVTILAVEKNLRDYSNNDPEIAKKIILEAIGNGYKGFFRLKGGNIPENKENRVEAILNNTYGAVEKILNQYKNGNTTMGEGAIYPGIENGGTDNPDRVGD